MNRTSLGLVGLLGVATLSCTHSTRHPSATTPDIQSNIRPECMSAAEEMALVLVSGPVRYMAFPEQADLDATLGKETLIVGKISDLEANELFQLAKAQGDAPVLEIRKEGTHAEVTSGWVYELSSRGERLRVYSFVRCQDEWVLIRKAYMIP